jgi:hypothetical protein
MEMASRAADHEAIRAKIIAEKVSERADATAAVLALRAPDQAKLPG